MIRFDSSAPSSSLQEKDAALSQAQATLDQAVAQAASPPSRTSSDLADAKFNVEKARLEASKQEIVRPDSGRGKPDRPRPGGAEAARCRRPPWHLHDASNNRQDRLAHAPARPGASRRGSHQARIAQMEIKAPITGILIFSTELFAGLDERQAVQGRRQRLAGARWPKFPTSTRWKWKARWKRSTAAASPSGRSRACTSIRCPSSPSPPSSAQISLLAEQSFEWPPTRSFRGYARASPSPIPRLRPGMNGGMDIVINRIPERHQHSLEGPLHARGQAHRLSGGRATLPPGGGAGAGAQSG